MANISSHVLDSVIGTHASGIRVECYRRDAGRTALVFDVKADAQGRIAETVDMFGDTGGIEYELVFHAKAYYSDHTLPDDGFQILNSIVLRLDLPDADGNYHLPIMLAPHSYSVWWSGSAPSNT